MKQKTILIITIILTIIQIISLLGKLKFLTIIVLFIFNNFILQLVNIFYKIIKTSIEKEIKNKN